MQNAQKTLFQTVNLNLISGKFSQPLLSKAIQVHTQPVHLWDFQSALTEVLHPHDEVHVILPAAYFQLRVVEVFKDSLGELGDLVGWHRLYGGPWKHPAVVDEMADGASPPRWLTDLLPSCKEEDFSVIKR